jgi:hypothetical protein
MGRRVAKPAIVASTRALPNLMPIACWCRPLHSTGIPALWAACGEQIHGHHVSGTQHKLQICATAAHSAASTPYNCPCAPCFHVVAAMQAIAVAACP